jgi:hypothetical protein
LALLFCAVLILYKAVHGLLLHDGVAPAEGEIQPVFSMVGRFTCLLAGVTVLARIPRLTRVWYLRLFGWLFFLLSVGGYWAFYRADPQGSPPWSYLGIAVVLLAITYTISALVPRWGMRALLIPGSLAVAYVVYDKLKVVHGAHGSLWPVFLAGAVFLYLWWLVALLFDLTFVWHRYIRRSLKIFERQVGRAQR